MGSVINAYKETTKINLKDTEFACWFGDPLFSSLAQLGKSEAELKEKQMHTRVPLVSLLMFFRSATTKATR